MTKDQMQKRYEELYDHYTAACVDLSKERRQREQLSVENFELKAKLEKALRSRDALIYRISLEDSL